MNILVLGGNGYLGNKLIQQLLCEKSNSIVFTKRPSSDLQRLYKFLNNEHKIKAVPATPEAVETAMIYEKFDVIFNMACSYGRKNMLYNDVIEANIEFPLRIFNYAVGGGGKKIYYHRHEFA